MNTNATIKDVARLAGVSTATVSLVVNQKEGVKPETRERVLAGSSSTANPIRSASSSPTL